MSRQSISGKQTVNSQAKRNSSIRESTNNKCKAKNVRWMQAARRQNVESACGHKTVEEKSDKNPKIVSIWSKK